MAARFPSDLSVERIIGVGESSLRYSYDLTVKGQKIELGRGTFGEVFSATDLNTNTHIAIKEIVIRRQQGDIRHLQNEIQLHASLNHENIVQYKGTICEDGVLKIFMERVNGGSLSDLLRLRWGPLSHNERAMQHYTRQMLQGLVYLHENSIIHRDIKGTNMLIDTYNGILKLADFGTSKALATIATNRCNTNYVGTPLYMAPEVINHQYEGYSTKADIWSAGCTVIEMATAKVPFHTMERDGGYIPIIFKVGNGTLKPPIPRDISLLATEFIQRCLISESSQRPTAQELLSDPFILSQTVGLDSISHRPREIDVDSAPLPNTEPGTESDRQSHRDGTVSHYAGVNLERIGDNMHPPLGTRVSREIDRRNGEQAESTSEQSDRRTHLALNLTASGGEIHGQPNLIYRETMSTPSSGVHTDSSGGQSQDSTKLLTLTGATGDQDEGCEGAWGGVGVQPSEEQIHVVPSVSSQTMSPRAILTSVEDTIDVLEGRLSPVKKRSSSDDHNNNGDKAQCDIHVQVDTSQTRNSVGKSDDTLSSDIVQGAGQTALSVDTHVSGIQGNQTQTGTSVRGVEADTAISGARKCDKTVNASGDSSQSERRSADRKLTDSPDSGLMLDLTLKGPESLERDAKTAKDIHVATAKTDAKPARDSAASKRDAFKNSPDSFRKLEGSMDRLKIHDNHFPEKDEVFRDQSLQLRRKDRNDDQGGAGVVIRRASTNASRITRTLSTEASSTESLRIQPGHDYVAGMRDCPLGHVPYVTSRLKLKSDAALIARVTADLSERGVLPGAGDVLLQGVIPAATRDNQLHLLAQVSRLAHCDTVREQSLFSLLRALYKTPEECHNFAELLQKLEPVLRISLQVEMWNESMNCAILRQHCYLLLLVQVYLQWLMKKLDNPRVASLCTTRDDVMKNLRRFWKERVMKSQHDVERFRFILNFIDHILMKRLATNRASFKKVFKTNDKEKLKKAGKLLQDVQYLCCHQMEGQKLEKDVITKCVGLDPLDAHIFLHYVVSKACSSGTAGVAGAEHILTFIRHLMHAMDKSKMLTSSSDFIISTLYAFKRILMVMKTPQVCRDIVSVKGNPSELGLRQVLFRCEAQATQAPRKMLILQVCAFLLFHPVAEVQQEIVKYGFGTTRDNALKDASVNLISSYYRDYIRAMMRVHNFKTYTGSVACAQCAHESDQWHETWEATCDYDNDLSQVVVCFERPIVQRMKGLWSGGNESRSLKNDIEILRRLNSGGSHPNIIQLLAYHQVTAPVFYMAESMGTSVTLQHFLQYKRTVQPALSLVDLLQSGVLPMIAAVEYCHDNNILLRNITASAFLAKDLGATFTIKLASFHLARVGNAAVKSPDRKSLLGNDITFAAKLCYIGTKLDSLPLLWSAPESVLQCVFSEHSDAYMVAHTVLEILTLGQPPYAELRALPTAEKVTQVHKHGIRPEKPQCVPLPIYKAAMECQSVVPSHRASLLTLQRKLKQQIRLIMDLQDIPEEETFMLPDVPQTEDASIYMSVPEGLRNVHQISDLQSERPGLVLFDLSDNEDTEIKCTTRELHALDDPCINPRNVLESRVLSGRHMSGAQLNLLLQLSHPHLVRVLQRRYDDEHNLFLDTELLGGQRVTLIDYVMKTPQVPVSWCMGVFRQLASALEYLHEHHLIHCCLAARFVYVSPHDPSIVKLGHLSRSCMLEEGPYDGDITSVTAQPFLALPLAMREEVRKMARWSPKEVNIHGTYSMRSDVASFAHLMWEVLRARLCDGDTDPTHVAPYANVALRKVLFYQNLRQTLPQPKDCPAWLYTLIKKCTLDPWFRRPMFPEILECLKSAEPSEHPLCKLPDVSDENVPKDIFEMDDQLYNFYEIGTPEYRRRFAYQCWQRKFKDVLAELQANKKKHLDDKAPNEIEDGPYLDVATLGERSMSTPSFLQSLSHTYMDIDDASSVGAYGVGAIPRVPSHGGLPILPPKVPQRKGKTVSRFLRKLLRPKKGKAPHPDVKYIHYVDEAQSQVIAHCGSNLKRQVNIQPSYEAAMQGGRPKLSYVSDDVEENYNSIFYDFDDDHNDYYNSTSHNKESDYDEIPFEKNERKSTIQYQPLPSIPQSPDDPPYVNVFTDGTTTLASLSSFEGVSDIETPFHPHSSKRPQAVEPYLCPLDLKQEKQEDEEEEEDHFYENTEVEMKCKESSSSSSPSTPRTNRSVSQPNASVYSEIKRDVPRRVSAPIIRSSSSSDDSYTPKLPAKSFADAAAIEASPLCTESAEPRFSAPVQESGVSEGEEPDYATIDDEQESSIPSETAPLPPETSPFRPQTFIPQHGSSPRNLESEQNTEPQAASGSGEAVFISLTNSVSEQEEFV